MIHKKIIDTPRDCAHRLKDATSGIFDHLCTHKEGPIRCPLDDYFPKHCPLQDLTLKTLRRSRINCYYVRHFKECTCKSIRTLHCIGVTCGKFKLKADPYVKIN